MRYNGSWKYRPEGRSDANDHELQNAPGKLKNETESCLACEHGIDGNPSRKHTVVCRQTIRPSLVTDSLWTVKFDADGKVLKRHGHDDDVDPRDSKCVRFTHKQLDKRPDLKFTDDTVEVFFTHTVGYNRPPSAVNDLSATKWRTLKTNS